MIAHLKVCQKALECFGWKGRRAVHGLIAQGVAVEENRLGLTGIGRVCGSTSPYVLSRLEHGAEQDPEDKDTFPMVPATR